MDINQEQAQGLWKEIFVAARNQDRIGKDEETDKLIDSFYKFEDNKLYIRVELTYVKNKIEQLYSTGLNIMAEKFFQEKVLIRFVTQDDIDLLENKKNDDLFQTFNKGNLNPTLNFMNFVAGESNFYALRMSQDTAENPGYKNSPLYIFGDVGLGKTHLMQAVGNYMLEKNVKLNILYIPATVFTDDYLTMYKKNINEFYKKYRDIDCLLVDDIQSLRNSTNSAEEFFNTFEYLYKHNIQIVLTSDKPPLELKDIHDRLRTRFQMGNVVDIKAPNYELRVRILNKKLQNDYPKSVIVENEAIEFIAKNFTKNIRELEGALKRAISYCQISNMPINRMNTEEALEVLLRSQANIDRITQSSFQKVISVVASYNKVEYNDLISANRKSEFVKARHIAMYIIKKLYNIEYTNIGLIFGGRDHSTVISAINRIESEVKKDETLRKIINILIKKINDEKVS